LPDPEVLKMNLHGSLVREERMVMKGYIPMMFFEKRCNSARHIGIEGLQSPQLVHEDKPCGRIGSGGHVVKVLLQEVVQCGVNQLKVLLDITKQAIIAGIIVVLFLTFYPVRFIGACTPSM
jgi:hypothetical protein